jgi:hypothetical protein
LIFKETGSPPRHAGFFVCRGRAPVRVLLFKIAAGCARECDGLRAGN